jgi:hypothetical protein
VQRGSGPRCLGMWAVGVWWEVLPDARGGGQAGGASGFMQHGSGGWCIWLPVAGVRLEVPWAPGRDVRRVVHGVVAVRSGKRCIRLWEVVSGKRCIGCGWQGSGVACVGFWGSACSAADTRSGCRWGLAPPRRKHSHGQPCSSTRRELVVLVQRKLQSSYLKLMNSALQGRNRWKASLRALVPLAGDMRTVSHTFTSCPEATASSCRAGLRLNAPWLGSHCTAVLESSSETGATVGTYRYCFETRFVTVFPRATNTVLLVGGFCWKVEIMV